MVPSDSHHPMNGSSGNLPPGYSHVRNVFLHLPRKVMRHLLQTNPLSFNWLMLYSLVRKHEPQELRPGFLFFPQVAV
jgi:hypothetical protein